MRCKMTSATQIKSILLAFRPKTLTAALVPCVAGTALVKAIGLSWDGWVLFYALMASFLIQIGTNLVNDAVDFKKGADTEKRIGPQRITQAGILTANQVMLLGSLCFALAVMCGIPLVLKGGWVIVAIGVASVLMGYSYTAGPFPLAYLGLGDLFVIIFFGLLAVTGIVFLNTGEWLSEAFVLGLQIGLHATVLIAINNLRDHAGDRLVNKKTLAVRFGVKFSRWEIAALAFLPFVLNLYWWFEGYKIAAIVSMFALPLAVKITKNVFATEPSPAYNKFLGQAAGLHLLFGLLIAIGFAF
ncbi:1,4-dihydroxy-2-naphthoate octaprenyltransferase [Bdellovibrio bacteriovorus]|uniref:1,4-dihydroxy-2-naphthoate octaprenyltransferase n=2 Tax=Bdellovibrio bacteriovorus TaxID=959 RepID=Q6MQC8_BDEBA|nr:1,4-dihydroxy-2-naphthoate octaprenyltransferase [Bdellovibrio bacteriovorus]AHZ86633.1 1,4-dihydroxy-2-naphthoate prenyltransferase [Bdellovibrio bacteriovorus]BEV67074.1 1,4-dihydroxy-2-naphthoate octaprenyltransferase [Bdellovibrio bacteriovorus]CAE78519.1 1,4-dihydroxy-2-naphthoate octaprenyltransferase [Bdellovibrio bacteriovorus HD100]